MQTILSQPGKNCKCFDNVVPMKTLSFQQRSRRQPRPQIIRCAECGGSRRLEYLDPDTCAKKIMPCVFCDERGYYIRNASRTEHRSLVQRLGVWSWAVLRAVLL